MSNRSRCDEGSITAFAIMGLVTIGCVLGVGLILLRIALVFTEVSHAADQVAIQTAKDFASGRPTCADVQTEIERWKDEWSVAVCEFDDQQQIARAKVKSAFRIGTFEREIMGSAAVALTLGEDVR